MTGSGTTIILKEKVRRSRNRSQNYSEAKGSEIKE
jgi:hypothetical protein